MIHTTSRCNVEVRCASDVKCYLDDTTWWCQESDASYTINYQLDSLSYMCSIMILVAVTVIMIMTRMSQFNTSSGTCYVMTIHFFDSSVLFVSSTHLPIEHHNHTILAALVAMEDPGPSIPTLLRNKDVSLWVTRGGRC